MSVLYADVLELSNQTGHSASACRLALEKYSSKEKALEFLKNTFSRKQTTISKEIFSHYDFVSDTISLIGVQATEEILALPQFLDLIDSYFYEIANFNDLPEKNELICSLEKEYNTTINFSFQTLKKQNSTHELLTSYIHEDKIGSIVGIRLLEGDPGQLKLPIIKNFAFDLAMHVVAFKPLSIVPGKIPDDLKINLISQIEEELERTNKPMAIWSDIIAGKLQRFIEKNCLISQIFIKSDTKTVKEIQSSIENDLKIKLEIFSIKRFEF